MKKNFKNLMALVLTGAMLTAGASAFAANIGTYTGGTSDDTGSTVSGTGGKVDIGGARVIEVVLPTTGVKFWLDPSGAMSLVDGGDITFESGASVYFPSEYDDDQNPTTPTAYGSKSSPKAFAFKNLGIMPVNIQADVKANGSTTAKIDVKKTFTATPTGAEMALSVGMENKDGIALAPLKPIDGTATTSVYSLVEDSRNIWSAVRDTTGTDPFKVSYSKEGEDSDAAMTGIVFSGELNLAFDGWTADLASSTIQPDKLEIQTIYNLSELKNNVVKVANPAASTVLTLKGVEKATGSGNSANPGTTEIYVKVIEGEENQGKVTPVALADTSGNVSVKAADQLEFKAGAWEDLYKMVGSKGVATLMIFAPGSQGVLVTLR